MSEKILFAHHHEPYWEEGLDKYGTTFEKEHLSLIDHILFSDEKYDKVIVTSFDNENSEGIELLMDICAQKGIEFENHEYGYGMERSEDSIDAYPIEELNDTWCFGGRNYHTEEDVLDIHDWMKDLKGSEVHLVGAFEGECLNDIAQIFDSLNINYQEIPSLCVGPSQTPYSMKCEEKLSSLQSDLISRSAEVEDAITDSLEKYDIADLNELISEKPKVAYQHLSDFCDAVEAYRSGLDDMEVELDVIQAMLPDSNLVPDIDTYDDMLERILENEINGDSEIFEIRSKVESLNDKRSKSPSLSYHM